MSILDIRKDVEITQIKFDESGKTIIFNGEYVCLQLNNHEVIPLCNEYSFENFLKAMEKSRNLWLSQPAA